MREEPSARCGRPAGWVVAVGLTAFSSAPIPAPGTSGNPPPTGATAPVPDTWDETRLASLQVPLAQAGVSARHVSKAYYTSLPVRPIYKSYDVYRPDLEPKGYFDWLRAQAPEVVW